MDCKECGSPFTSRRADREFCSSGCKLAWNNRRIKRGLAIYDKAMRWRKERTKDAFSDLCAQISTFIQEDNERGKRGYNDIPAWKRAELARLETIKRNSKRRATAA